MTTKRERALQELSVTDPVCVFTVDSLVFVDGHDPTVEGMSYQAFDYTAPLKAGTVVTVLRWVRDLGLPAGIVWVKVAMPDGQERWLVASERVFRRTKG